MKKIVFYFDPTVPKMFVEKEDESGKKKIQLSTNKNFVNTAEIVARAIEIDDEDQIPTRIDPGYKYYKVYKFISIKVDTGIYYDSENKCYKASSYGFVVFQAGKLRLFPVLSIPRDKVKAYFFIHPTKFLKVPKYSDIQEFLHDSKITMALEKEKIEGQLKKIDVSTPKLVKILVAQGMEPKMGHPEYYEGLIRFEKHAGKLLSDGRIDFKQVGSSVEVKIGQDVLRRIPPVKEVPGINIYGDKIASETEVVEEGYKKGDNFIVSNNDSNIFQSEIDGCIDIQNNKVSVLPIVVINGDVNYDTGNIDFNGSVHIMGSVIPGFSVKAKGDVIIENIVEDSVIEADGDITVKMGVVGKESVKLISSGKINAKYLLNAKVEATGEVVVEDSIINCNVFSNDRVSVIAKSGKIIGGDITALYCIEAKVSGAPNETVTNLRVGRNLFIERELAEVNEETAKWREKVNDTIVSLKVGFGEGVFEDPKEYIVKLPSIKKKKCLILLKELSESNKKLKVLAVKSEEIRSKLKLDREPVIILTQKIYPGTVLYIKKSVKKIIAPHENVKFYEDVEEKLIKFTSAV